MAVPTSALKTERLINLVMCLRWARRPLTRADLFRLLPDYGTDSSEAARLRMFERDKDELRAAGYDIVTVNTPGAFEDETGYVLEEAPPGPAWELSSADRMYLAVAGNVWTHTHTHHAALRALHKLGVPSQHPLRESPWGTMGIVAPHIAAAVDACVRARQHEVAVEFAYRSAGEADAAQRTVSPWSLGLIGGTWYMAGFDEERQARRVFRLDRMTTTPQLKKRVTFVSPPAEFSWVHVRHEIGEVASVAVLCVASERARVELHAMVGAQAEDTPGAGPSHDTWPVRFWVVAETAAVESISRYGPECVPLSPLEVVDGVRASWKAALKAHADEDAGLDDAAAQRLMDKAQSVGVTIPGSEQHTTVGVHRTEESGLERSLRLMTMVPWLLSHQGVDVTAAAAHFGVTPDMIAADLQVLFLCGTPGGLPGDLIEATWDDGRIYIDNAEALGECVNLTAEEGWPLWVGLQVLAAHVGEGSPEAEQIRRLQDGLAHRCGLPHVDHSVPWVEVEPMDPQVQEVRERCAASIAQGQGMAFVYASQHSQSLRHREVVPRRVKYDRGHWYLEADEGGVPKDFRLDRMREVCVVTVPTTSMSAAASPSPRWELAVVDVHASAAAVAEYFGAVPVGRARTGGWRRCVVGGYRWEWLVAQVLAAQGTLRVVYPPTLRDAVAARAHAALAAVEREAIRHDTR